MPDGPAPTGNDEPPGTADRAPGAGDERSPDPDAGVTSTVEDLVSDLRDLPIQDATDSADADGPVADTAEDGHAVGTVEQLLFEAHSRGLIGSRIRRLDVRDAAEAFVGSVIFASPLLVEDGIFDIAAYLFGFRVLDVPWFLLANTIFVVLMTYALIEWTGRNREETAMVFGVIPIRVVMTLVISFVVAAVLMTVWGRVNAWASPVQALARINVIWTVGALGAALGDIIATDEPGDRAIDPADFDLAPPAATTTTTAAGSTAADRAGASADGTETPIEALSDAALLETLEAEFDDLEETVAEHDARDELERIREDAIEAALDDDGFGDTITKYTGRDVAEGFVGSIFFAIPFLVEDGVFDVADYFLAFRLAGFPVFFIANALFVLLMILALVYWAGPQDVQVYRPIFGVIPRRLVGIAVVSFLTAAALMTMWGRVANWTDPIVALARISVVWTVASFGAALGDILPGESSGADITDELETLVD